MIIWETHSNHQRHPLLDCHLSLKLLVTETAILDTKLRSQGKVKVSPFNLAARASDSSLAANYTLGC